MPGRQSVCVVMKFDRIEIVIGALIELAQNDAGKNEEAEIAIGLKTPQTIIRIIDVPEASCAAINAAAPIRST